MKSNLSREDMLVQMVKQAQAGQFKLTGIKVEFEAKFFRHLADSRCDYCGGSGRETCESCDGSGHYPCDDCGGTGCSFCDHGHIECADCEGLGIWDCENCDGPVEGHENLTDWNNMRSIHDRILSKLVRSGLAERIPRGQDNEYGHKYRPKSPLVFSKVYNDATVDTEQTVTLLMDNPENVLLFPKLLKAFYSLKEDIGQGVDTSNAGMHITLLNSDGAVYPTSSYNDTRFQNFRRSMILLMPALYFLGSCDEKARPMGYRVPTVARQHTAAINYSGGGLEFRVFETCYEHPDMILDDIAVALNCLRFWTKHYTRNYLAKIANNVDFGLDGDEGLKRLYVTSEHIELLNRGLRIIKPPYLTVTEIKQQRNFTVTKLDTRDREKRIREQAELEYKEYEKRFSWELVMQRNNYIAQSIQERILYVPNQVVSERPEATPDKIKEVEDEAEKRLQEWAKRHKLSMDKYCAETIPRIGQAGKYKLSIEGGV